MVHDLVRQSVVNRAAAAGSKQEFYGDFRSPGRRLQCTPTTRLRRACDEAPALHAREPRSAAPVEIGGIKPWAAGFRNAICQLGPHPRVPVAAALHVCDCGTVPTPDPACSRDAESSMLAGRSFASSARRSDRPPSSGSAGQPIRGRHASSSRRSWWFDLDAERMRIVPRARALNFKLPWRAGHGLVSAQAHAAGSRRTGAARCRRGVRQPPRQRVRARMPRLPHPEALNAAHHRHQSL